MRNVRYFILLFMDLLLGVLFYIPIIGFADYYITKFRFQLADQSIFACLFYYYITLDFIQTENLLKAKKYTPKMTLLLIQISSTIRKDTSNT